MENVTLDRAVEVVRALTPGEQQLRTLMDSWQAPPSTETAADQQRRLAESLLAKGLLEHIPTDAYTEVAWDWHDPIKVSGRPVSETFFGNIAGRSGINGSLLLRQQQPCQAVHLRSGNTLDSRSR